MPRVASAQVVATPPGSKRSPSRNLVCHAARSASGHSSSLRHRTLAVLDADPTQGLSRWATQTYEGAAFRTIAEPDETRLAHLIAEQSEEVELVLVDTAGFGNRVPPSL